MSEAAPEKEKMSFSDKLRKFSVGKLLVLTFVCSAAVFVLVYAAIILFSPKTMFETGGTGETASTVSGKVGLHGTDAASAPEAVPLQNGEIPDSGMLNILLCGIDGYEDGSSTSGTQPHTDANVVISINFDKGTVDLVSILRDSFSVAPGYYGYYKFNSIFNIRGGVDNPYESMELTCDAAEQWMGGISIPYYYALDFQAVIDVIDAIGGIDYDVELYYEDIYYNWVSPGYQRLNGAEVMGYMRIRTADDGLDSTRTARQRKMLLAIFDQIRKENLFAVLPEIINSAASGIYTNTTLAQTAALAKYAMSQDPAKIYTHSLTSDLCYNYDWVLNFPKAEERRQLLKEVYGIDAENVITGSECYEGFLYQSGFATIKCYRQAEKVLKNVNAQLENGLEMNEWQETLYYGCYASYSKLVDEFDATGVWVDAHRNMGLYTFLADNGFKQRCRELSELQTDVRFFTEKLRDELCPDQQLKWNRTVRWDQDPDIDEVVVDFA